QRDAELAADQLADQLAGPEGEGELQLSRVTPGDQRVDLPQLDPGQLAGPPRDRLGPQRVHTTLAVLCQPAEHRRTGHAQRGRDVLRVRAGPDLFDRADPQLLQGVVVELATVVVAHATSDYTHDPIVHLLMTALVSAGRRRWSLGRHPGPGAARASGTARRV